MEGVGTLPLLIAIAAAFVYGAIGFYFRRSVLGWAVAGLLAGLGVATICIGLNEAATLPYTSATRESAHLQGALIAVVILGLVGGLSFFGVRRVQSA
jgi:hypothetical protein